MSNSKFNCTTDKGWGVSVPTTAQSLVATSSINQEIPDMDNDMPAFWTQVLGINQTLEHKKPLGRQTSLSLVCREKSRSREYISFPSFIHLLTYLLSIRNVPGTVLGITASGANTVLTLTEHTVQRRQALNYSTNVSINMK